MRRVATVGAAVVAVVGPAAALTPATAGAQPPPPPIAGNPAIALPALNSPAPDFPVVAPAEPATGGPPAPHYAAGAPVARTLYRYGPDGRFLLDGAWLFRYDNFGQGTAQHLERSTSIAGWRPVAVPYAWNGHDESPHSMGGTVGWYRKDFLLPGPARPRAAGGAGATWIVRFESVNYRAQVWLNGQPLGSHSGFGLPFEFALPARLLKPGHVNRLVLRVDNRRHISDLPPASFAGPGIPSGGYWNYGGILREVYLRRVARVDMSSVQVLPVLPCPSCPARLRYRVSLHNYAGSPQRVALTARFGSGPAAPAPLATVTLGRGASRTVVATVGVGVVTPWSPANPYLYDVNVIAGAGGPGKTPLAHWYLRTGVRSIQVSPDGMLLLNGQVLNARGAGLLEDSPLYGSAVDDATRARWIAEARALGATILRSQYPLHPYTEELADANGILLWSEIPAFSMQERVLGSSVVQALARDALTQNIVTNGSHPSIITWSIANELSATPTSPQDSYIAHMASVAHALDPTRPVSLAVAGSPAAGCQAGPYAPLDLIGLNDYFGWYQGKDDGIADRELLSAYLDSMRACYPHKALMVSEFGAEANRSGPTEERGTYAFQSDWLDYQLGTLQTKPWLAAAVWWALEEFRVRPLWDGGDPHPASPVHNKGLITFLGQPKPAFYEAQKQFRAVPVLRAR